MIKAYTSKKCSTLQAHTSPISFSNDPPTSKEALTGPHSSDFLQAELDKLCQLNTWSIVNRDEIKNQSAILHSTWVYKIKRLPSGLIDKFKARLCASEDLQQHGLNNSETYSSFVQWSTVCLCLILAHKYELLTHQCDYSNAYCQSPLEEELYMEIPPRFSCNVRTKKRFRCNHARKRRNKYVLKLNMALRGL